tara:strand:+ start:1674 stop:1892 length:219 start_codon:yes stop_codon:yes gene_type:complete
MGEILYIMKQEIKDMTRFFIVLLAMIVSIIVGVLMLSYALANAWKYILCFVLGVTFLGVGLFALRIVTKQLK